MHLKGYGDKIYKQNPHGVLREEGRIIVGFGIWDIGKVDSGKNYQDSHYVNVSVKWLDIQMKVPQKELGR